MPATIRTAVSTTMHVVKIGDVCMSLSLLLSLPKIEADMSEDVLSAWEK